MSLSNLIRWGVPGALLAGTAWMMAGFFFFVFPGKGDGSPGSLSYYLIHSSHATAELGMLAALVGLHIRQAPRYGRMGTAGFVVAFVGTACFFSAAVLGLFAPDAVGIFFLLGLPGWLIGFPLLGMATLRARVLQRLCGWLLVAYAPGFFVAFSLLPTAVIWNGLVWLALGYALWSWNGAPIRQPSSVS